MQVWHRRKDDDELTLPEMIIQHVFHAWFLFKTFTGKGENSPELIADK
jgi:hypothetical protein